MPRTVTTENPTKDVCRYLRHWGRVDLVEEELQRRHHGLPAEKRRRKARSACLAVLQGLEFLEASAMTSVLTRPLPLFYGVENLAKALCLIVDRDLEATNFRAHGLRGDKSRRYSIKNLECTVTAPGSDVWSRVFRIANADWCKLEWNRNNVGLIQDHRNHYATAPLRDGSCVSVGALMRRLPELAHDVELARWGVSFMVPVEVFTMRNQSGPPEIWSLTFMLNHEHHDSTKAMIIDRESDLLRRFARTRDEFNVIEYRLLNSTDAITSPVKRFDVFGKMFMDFARGTFVVSETVIYLALLFILADAVRYQPDQWKRLLDDHPAEAILVERFLDLVPRKFPNLILNELSETFTLFRSTA